MCSAMKFDSGGGTKLFGQLNEIVYETTRQ
jgi:hypothetical protein